MVMLTSGGRDRVAPPTREAHGVEVENDRTLGVEMKAGRRKAGRDSTGGMWAMVCRTHRPPPKDSIAAIYGVVLIHGNVTEVGSFRGRSRKRLV